MILTLVAALALPANAQDYAWQLGADAGRLDLGHDIHYMLQAQGSASHGTTPLWLNANRYGLSSLDEHNGYLRAAVERPLNTDSARRWGVGYGLDAAVATHYTSDVVLQQAYVEGRWLHGVLTIGAKQWPMEMKNQRLSSGSQTLGINARPIPQARLALERYWTIPGTRRWLQVKGHVAYGMLTDDSWQHDFTQRRTRYEENVKYCSRAGFLRVGKDDIYPLSVEAGLEMATMFGGECYRPTANGEMHRIKNSESLKSYWHAFFTGGADAPEVGSVYQNEEGNIVGSWLMRVNYDTEQWALHVYADKYFDDISSMFQLDYNGYGSGEEWDKKKDMRFFVYDGLKDWMLGTELNLKHGTWLRDIVVEYLYTKYQSGPIYHDHTQGQPYHICGTDNYYNHYIYTGWQHWGQVIGNPLYRSPLYNDDGTIYIKDNRFVAWHLGLDGQPLPRLGYRLLASYQKGYGTYERPYVNPRENFSMMVEATYTLPHQWTITGAWGLDSGRLIGHNNGFQLTITKHGVFNL